MRSLKNIMLVDDNKIDLFINQKIIAKYNSKLNVIAFSCPISALNHIKNNNLHGFMKDQKKPNIILLDLNMPQCNGFQFLEEFRKLDVKKIKIFVVSSSGCVQDINNVKNNPLVTGYIVKPLTLDKLSEAIDKAKRCLGGWGQSKNDFKFVSF